jgi:integration host factor subunit alpha
MPRVQKAVTRADLLQAICRAKPNLSQAQARAIFETTLKELAAALVQGENVKLQSFGLFSVRWKRERIGRNPKTGVEATIKKRRVLAFKPSSVLVMQISKTLSRKAGSDEQVYRPG